MNILLPFCLFFAFLCWVNRKNKRISFFLFTSFSLLLIVLLAIRFEFGPDYFNYWTIFDSVQGEDINNYKGSGNTIESLFLRYMQVFPNYSSFVAFNSLLWVSVLYWLVVKFVNTSSYWIVILFLIVDPNLIIGSSVAMRSAIASVIFIIAIYYFISEYKYSRIVYVLLIILASLIHTSSLVFLPLFLIPRKKKSILSSYSYVVVLTILSLLIVITHNNFIFDIVYEVLFSNVEELGRYENYNIGTTSSISAVLFRILLAFILFCIVTAANKDSNKNFIYVYNLGILAISLQLVFGQSIVSDRFLMYLCPFYIISLCRSRVLLPKKLSFIALIIAIAIPSYLLSIKMGKEYAVTFHIYQTIFSSSYIP